MKWKNITVLVILTASITIARSQQKVIPLYQGKAPGSENWDWDEKVSDSNMFKTTVVYNVSHPTLTAFIPDSTIATGTAVIICPGGGFHTLSINSEGIDLAKWLVKKGVAAFVLKYRIVKSNTDDPVKEMFPLLSDKKKLDEINAPVVPLAMQDGLAAMKYVRSHAAEYDINPSRIGFMGFSAGGTVTMSVVYNATDENRPDFIAPIYAYMGAVIGSNVPTAKVPAFIVAASDDQLGLASHSVAIYDKWLEAKQSAELHMYEKGGHGFGMRKQKLPTDNWYERFGEWMKFNGYLKKLRPSALEKRFSEEQVEAYQKLTDERMKVDWPYIKKYEAANATLGPARPGTKRIVFMGNSITEGWVNTDSLFFKENDYVGRGISGQTTSQMLVRFREDVINLKPDAVVILAGINDIAENTGPISLENVAGNIISMAELAKVNHIKVVLSSVLPAFDFNWHPGLAPAEKVVKLNAMIKAYADKSGCIYLDYFSKMADERKGLPPALSYDGVHPTLAGYKVMEPLAKAAISKALEAK